MKQQQLFKILLYKVEVCGSSLSLAIKSKLYDMWDVDHKETTYYILILWYEINP